MRDFGTSKAEWLQRDPRRAEAHFQECRNYGKPVRWCYFGEALALEERGGTEKLEFVR